MEPVFTLPYSEYAAANLLSTYFKSKDGYSVFVPASRQQRGVDLLLAKRDAGGTGCISIQVKSSRTYMPPPAKRARTQRFAYYTWFNTFAVAPEADFFLLFGLYPGDVDRAKKSDASWWNSLVLAFSNAEMTAFIDSIKTRQHARDPMFGFGFENPLEVHLTRGDPNRTLPSFSHHALERQLTKIGHALDARCRK